MVVLIAIVVGGVWWGWKSLSKSTADPNCVQQKLPNNRMVPDQVVINVYNGGAKAGTAAETAAVLEKRGFNIGKIMNEPHGKKINVLAVRGTTAKAPEVLLVAGQMSQKAAVYADSRPDHTVDIVVGKGFTTVNPKALPSVVVPSNQTVCIPAPKGTQPIPSGQNPN
jgi:hypothetical protein